MSLFVEDFQTAVPPDIGGLFTLEGPVNYWGTVAVGDGEIVARGDAEESYPYRPYSDGWIVFIDPTPKMPANLKKLHYGDKALEFMTKSSDRLIETLQPGMSLAASGGIIAPEIFTDLADEKRIELIENVLLCD